MSNERQQSQGSHEKDDGEDERSVYLCDECNKGDPQIHDAPSVYLKPQDDNAEGAKRRKKKKRTGTTSGEMVKQWKSKKPKSKTRKSHKKNTKKRGKKSSSSQDRRQRRRHRRRKDGSKDKSRDGSTEKSRDGSTEKSRDGSTEKSKDDSKEKTRDDSRESKGQADQVNSSEDPEASIREKRPFDLERARRAYRAKLKDQNAKNAKKKKGTGESLIGDDDKLGKQGLSAENLERAKILVSRHHEKIRRKEEERQQKTGRSRFVQDEDELFLQKILEDNEIDRPGVTSSATSVVKDDKEKEMGKEPTETNIEKGCNKEKENNKDVLIVKGIEDGKGSNEGGSNEGTNKAETNKELETGREMRTSNEAGTNKDSETNKEMGSSWELGTSRDAEANSEMATNREAGETGTRSGVGASTEIGANRELGTAREAAAGREVDQNSLAISHKEQISNQET